MEHQYFILENEVVSQPYSLEDLKSKNLTPTSLVCTKFGDWQPAKDIPEVAKLLVWQPKLPNETNWAPPPPKVESNEAGYFHLQPQQPIQQTIVINGANKKSTGLAFVLSFFFGPLGLFYASVTGGIVMLLITLIVGIITFGFGLIITQIICIIWAMIAVNNHNQNVSSQSIITQQPQVQNRQPVQSQPLKQQNTPIAIKPTDPAPKSESLTTSEHIGSAKISSEIHTNESGNKSSESQPKLEISTNKSFLDTYKIPVIIGGLALFSGAGFLVYYFLPKEEPLLQQSLVDTSEPVISGDPVVNSRPVQTVTVKTKEGSNLRLRSQPSDTAPVVASIPDGTTLEILGYSENYQEINGERAKWCNINYNGQNGWAWGAFLINNIKQENKESNSDPVLMVENQFLIDTYLGTIGNKDFKLFIEKVEEDNVDGYNVTGSNRRPVKGKIVNKRTEPTGFGGNYTVFKLILTEPGDQKWDGEFNIDLWISDVERRGEGNWKSFNGSLDRKIIIKDRMN
jgi:hypothetical protein